jgi:regulator of RNase E activity RraA
MPEVFSGPITLDDVRRGLFVAAVCDALDAIGCRAQAAGGDLRPLATPAYLVGRARTTLWVDIAQADPDPYALELRAVDALAPDDVFVAAAGASMRSGIWGELLSTAARHRGCAGAVIDGAARDVAAIRSMGFPVFARGACPLDSRDRQRVVDIDVAVEIGGARVRSGDLVLADEDGVVVVPREVEDEALRRAWDKVHRESAVREAIRGGMRAAEAFERFGTL